jgi:hypothetical protein
VESLDCAGAGRLLHAALRKENRMTGPGGQIVYDPRGIVEAQQVPTAPRPKTLDGVRLAVLDNTKWNAGKLLRRSMAQLGEEFRFAAVNYYRKESFSRVAAPQLVGDITANNDIVLTAIGD